jgi:hypothetical protein
VPLLNFRTLLYYAATSFPYGTPSCASTKRYESNKTSNTNLTLGAREENFAALACVNNLDRMP